MPPDEARAHWKHTDVAIDVDGRDAARIRERCQ
jgi:hypothetical protein